MLLLILLPGDPSYRGEDGVLRTLRLLLDMILRRRRPEEILIEIILKRKRPYRS